MRSSGGRALSIRASTASEESEHVFPSAGGSRRPESLIGRSPITTFMFELLFLICLVWPFMAKHAKRGGRRRPFHLRRVPVTPALSLGALVTVIAIKTSLVGTSDAQYRLMSANLAWTLHNHTAGEGPISVGLAFGSYTVTQIKECLEASASISPGDKSSQEKANRWVRTIGHFSGEGVSESLNDGKPISTRLNWAIPIGETVQMWAYNNDTNDLTTGSVVGAMGEIYVKDY